MSRLLLSSNEENSDNERYDFYRVLSAAISDLVQTGMGLTGEFWLKFPQKVTLIISSPLISE